MASEKGSSPVAQPALQTLMSAGPVATMAGTICPRMNSHTASSRKNPVTLIRIVLKR
jgi:hypothetical protein